MKQQIFIFYLFLIYIIPINIWGNQTCNHCNISLGNSWIEFEGNEYHEKCYKDHIQLKCQHCLKHMSDSYISSNDKSYHNKCYSQHILPKCDICLLPLETQYLIDAWGNQFHETHKNEGHECYSCSRIISSEITQGGFQLNDGRFLCSLCETNIIKTNEEIINSFNTVISKLNQVGISNIPTNIPIHLLYRNQITRKSELLASDHLKGFTHTKETTTIFSTSRDYTIFILNFLPKTEFNAILAHELLHVWLIEHEIEMNDKDTEGFCNLGSMLMYQHTNTQFSNIHLQNMDANEDAIYGDGYRKLKKQLEKLGWKTLIQNIKHK